MRLNRDITDLRSQPEHQYNDGTVLARGPFNTPEECIAVARLRLLPRLLRHGPECLLALLRTGNPMSPRDWIGAVAGDVGWMLQHLGGRNFEQEADNQRLLWASTEAYDRPKAWLARVRRAAASARLRRRNWHEAESGLAVIGELMTLAVFTVGRGTDAAVLAPALQGDAGAWGPHPAVLCPECGRGFKHAGALGMHRYRAHGVRRPARRFADSTACGACLQDFHTRGRILYHLTYSAPTCLDRLAAWREPLAEHEADALDAAETQRRKDLGRRGLDVAARLPVCRQSGPQLPPPPPPPPLAPDAVAAMPPSAAGPEAAQPSLEATPVGCPWARTGPAAAPPAVPFLAAPLLVLGGCPLVVLHLCSGRRRPGDVQSHLEEMAAHFQEHCGCEVAMVSIDVALDPV